MNRAYDCIVVGAGIGGLTCAAFLARHGKRVLVVEQHAIPGGCCTSFSRGDFVFESGVEWIDGFDKGIVKEVLEGFGIQDAVLFTEIDPMLVTVFPDHTVVYPQDYLDQGAALREMFPEEARNIEAFFRGFEKVNAQTQTLPEPGGLWSVVRTLLWHRSVISYLRKTYASLLDRYFTDPKLKAVLSGYCGMFGIPSSRLSAIALTTILGAPEAAGHVDGGMQKLADALADVIRGDGGEVVLKRKVTKIAADSGRVKGVVLDDGEELEADVVVANVDAQQVFADLLPDDAPVRRVADKIAQWDRSPTGFKVFLGVDMPLQPPENSGSVLYFPSYDVDGLVVNGPENPLAEDGCVLVFMPSLRDKALAPDGMHGVSLVVLGDYYDTVKDMDREQYEAFKEQLADVCIARAENVLPGLSSHIVVRDVATPLTVERYTLNSRGAFYGWNMTPESLCRSLAQETCVEGLYLVGHWTYPGGGVPTVMISGKRAAHMILGKR